MKHLKLKEINFLSLFKNLESFIFSENGLRYQKKIFLFSTVFSFLLLLKKHFQIILFPYQGGYREGMSPYITDLILRGENPFLIEKIPEAMNMYGILYSLICAPFVYLFSDILSSFVVHRFVAGISLFFILLLIGYIAKVDFKSNRKSLGIFLCIFYLAFFQEGLTFSTLLSQPGNTGLFLLLLGVLVPYKAGFSWPSLFLCIVFSILGFLAKPYFLFPILGVGLYLLLFQPKKKAILFGVLSVALMAFAAIFIYNLYPTYFLSTFYMAKSHYSPSSLSVEGKMSLRVYTVSGMHVLEQLKYFLTRYIGLLCAFCLCIFAAIRDRRNSRDTSSTGFNITKIDQPMVNSQFDYFLFLSLLGTVLFIIEFGHNVGAWMQYIVQLILPFIILFMLKTDSLLTSKERTFGHFVATLNLTLLLLFGHAGPALGFYQAPQGEKYTQFWDQAIREMKKHSVTFASPTLNRIQIDAEKEVLFTGHSILSFNIGKAFSGQNQNLPLTPNHAGRFLTQKLENYRSQFIENIKTQKFEVVVMDNQDLLYFQEEKKILEKYYEKYDEYQLDMPVATQHWVVYFYRPKTRNN